MGTDGLRGQTNVLLDKNCVGNGKYNNKTKTTKTTT